MDTGHADSLIVYAVLLAPIIGGITWAVRKALGKSTDAARDYDPNATYTQRRSVSDLPGREQQ